MLHLFVVMMSILIYKQSHTWNMAAFRIDLKDLLDYF